MSSKAIADPQHDQGPKDGRRPTVGEIAPSVMSEDDPTAARFVGLVAAILVILCGVFLAYNLLNPATPGKFQFPTGWLTISLVLGLVGLLFHAAYDRDVQFRRLYLIFGGAALIVGAFLCLVPNPKVGDQFRSGFPCMALALVFVLAALRNEDDFQVRNLIQLALGAVGSGMVLVGAIGGNINEPVFLVPYGLLLTLLGLCYLAGFVLSRGVGDDQAYWTGRGIGAFGLLVFVVAFLRSALPPLFYSYGWKQSQPAPYFIPFGLLLMVLGLVAMALSVGLCSENRLVVLIRRELASFFFTPVAYFVLIGFTLVTWVAFFIWFLVLPARVPVPEPVVGGFILQWPGVFLMLFGVPALTMRLLSEEKRTGTLEVLMTTPTEESTVVLSKFVAVLLLFLIMWVPFGLFVVAFRIMGGVPFDYLPLLSFAVALTVTGAGFAAAGLFFSSLTSNQIVSGILTFVFMMGMTFIFMVERIVQGKSLPFLDWVNPDVIKGVINHISYIDIWLNSFNGKLALPPLLFFASMTAWFLFLTVKVLEARKWS